ncbi:MAG TPA: TlpA disulfide reductase family protein [Planctomycetaceae bacterium]|nr:TlpA disulfide reductase family protein [Planctomycetaceae bacterium]
MSRRSIAFLLALAVCGCNRAAGPARSAATATETEKAGARKEISQLLASNLPFTFDFNLNDIAGQKLSKSDMAGHVLIVDIWGTWCPPCRMEIPHFVDLNNRYGDKGLRIVGLNRERSDNIEENTKLVQEFCRKEGVNYPCALITKDVMSQVPDFEGFPTTLFFDRTGQVRLKLVGAYDAVVLEAAVESLLNEQPADEGEKTVG